MSLDPSLENLLRTAWREVAHGSPPDELRSAFVSKVAETGWRQWAVSDPAPPELVAALRKACAVYNVHGLATADALLSLFLDRLALWAIEHA